MGNYTWNTSGSYYFGLFPGPTGPAGQDPNPAAFLISSSSVGATVEDNSVEPQIGADSAPYVQPDTSAPQENAEVDESSQGGAIPVSAIAVTEGENYEQPATGAPAVNPQIGVPAKNLNPMGL